MILEKIDTDKYSYLETFVKDFKLICDNCMKFNPSSTVYYKNARELLKQGNWLIKEATTYIPNL